MPVTLVHMSDQMHGFLTMGRVIRALHPVVLQFARIGHSFVGERVVTRSQYEGRGELLEVRR